MAMYYWHFVILQNLTRNYEILWKCAKVNESYNIPRYFLSQITHFRSISFNSNVLLAFRDFVPWQTNFSVCYHTVLHLGDIGKYFAIVKWKVIFPILQILNKNNTNLMQKLCKFSCVWEPATRVKLWWIVLSVLPLRRCWVESMQTEWCSPS